MRNLGLIKKEKGILHLNGITNERLLSLLCDKHFKDVIIPECKNGETWGARDLLKMDAWVLRRSYSPLTMIGYEIKSSRADFETDQKWMGYLDLCHEFYFVCPAGLIRTTDLPQQIGIIWASKDKLHTKRKAERLKPDMEKLNRLLVYVVMSRSKIVANMNEIYTEPPKNRLRLLKETVKEASERKELAYFVKGHIQEMAEILHKKEADLSYKENCIKDFGERLARLGIVWDSGKSDWQDNMRVGNEIDQLKNVLDIQTLRKIRATGHQMTELADIFEKLYQDY